MFAEGLSCGHVFTSLECPGNRLDMGGTYVSSMSTELDGYECRGDLDTPFSLSAKDERRQRDRQRMRDSMRCDVAPLTFERYRAGDPCPGCGRPYVDAEPFESKGSMHFSDAERERYDAEQLRFAVLHASCGSHRHGVAGSLTTHCGRCCPIPPLSPSQLERLGALMAPTPQHELMIWRLRLYCGHTVERSAHRSHKTVHSAFGGSVRCAECGCDPATIVDARAVRPAALPLRPEPTPAARKPTRTALERRIAELEAEVARLQANSNLNA